MFEITLPITFEGDTMTGSKLGIHIENWVGGQDMVDWVEWCKPKVVKSIDDAPSQVRACRAVSPDTFFIGRAYTSDQDMSNPLQAAQEHRDRILRKAMVRDVDAWEGWNEVCGGHGWNDETLRYIEAEDYLCDFLHAEGLKYIAGSWSVGCPSDLGVWWWHYMLNLMRKADYLGLHEYCAPTMWDIRAFDPPYTDKEQYLTCGWFTLRYRKVWDILKDYIPHPPPIIISECGIDSGAAHWPVDAQGGWKSFTTIEGCVEQLSWYDRQLCMDDYIIGAAIFTFGTRSQHLWETFDMWEPPEARQALGDYILSQHGENGGNGDEWENWSVRIKRSPDQVLIEASRVS